LIASAIARAKNDIAESEHSNRGRMMAGARVVENEIADVFALDNVAFNREYFIFCCEEDFPL